MSYYSNNCHYPITICNCYPRYNRPGGASSVTAMGDAIIPVKDVGEEPEIKSLKLINPDSGKFEGEVRLRLWDAWKIIIIIYISI